MSRVSRSVGTSAQEWHVWHASPCASGVPVPPWFTCRVYMYRLNRSRYGMSKYLQLSLLVLLVLTYFLHFPSSEYRYFNTIKRLHVDLHVYMYMYRYVENCCTCRSFGCCRKDRHHHGAVLDQPASNHGPSHHQQQKRNVAYVKFPTTVHYM